MPYRSITMFLSVKYAKTLVSCDRCPWLFIPLARNRLMDQIDMREHYLLNIDSHYSRAEEQRRWILQRIQEHVGNEREKQRRTFNKMKFSFCEKLGSE